MLFVMEWIGPGLVRSEPNCTKSSIKFLPIYYECMPVYSRCALLGNDAIGDEIYADKCKVALTNVVESILAHLLVVQHV